MITRFRSFTLLSDEPDGAVRIAKNKLAGEMTRASFSDEKMLPFSLSRHRSMLLGLLCNFYTVDFKKLCPKESCYHHLHYGWHHTLHTFAILAASWQMRLSGSLSVRYHDHSAVSQSGTFSDWLFREEKHFLRSLNFDQLLVKHPCLCAYARACVCVCVCVCVYVCMRVYLFVCFLADARPSFTCLGACILFSSNTHAPIIWYTCHTSSSLVCLIMHLANGVYSLKWRLTDRYLRWGTLAHLRLDLAEADQCKSSEFLHESRISGFLRYWVSPTCLRAPLLWGDAVFSRYCMNMPSVSRRTFLQAKRIEGSCPFTDSHRDSQYICVSMVCDQPKENKRTTIRLASATTGPSESHWKV